MWHWTHSPYRRVRRVRDEKAIEFDSAAMQRAIERQLRTIYESPSLEVAGSGIPFDGIACDSPAAQRWDDLLASSSPAEHEARLKELDGCERCPTFAARPQSVGIFPWRIGEESCASRIGSARCHWWYWEASRRAWRSPTHPPRGETFDGSGLNEIGVTCAPCALRDDFQGEPRNRETCEGRFTRTGTSATPPQSLLVRISRCLPIARTWGPSFRCALAVADVSGAARADSKPYVYSLKVQEPVQPFWSSVRTTSRRRAFADLPRSAVAYARTLVDLSIGIRSRNGRRRNGCRQARQSPASSLPVEEARATNMVAAARWVGGGERERREALQIWNSLDKELSSTTMSERVTHRVLWRFKTNLATAAAADQNAIVAGERAAAAAEQIIRSRQKLLAAPPSDGYRRERWYAAWSRAARASEFSAAKQLDLFPPDDAHRSTRATTQARRRFPGGMFGETATTDEDWITSCGQPVIMILPE